jgi:glycine cleavage system transcriptional repressor
MSNARPHDYAVTVIGRDRPGIVAAVSEALLELDCNLEDSHMSILRGHFTVMLIVRAPAATDEAALAGRLDRVRDELELEALTVQRVDELADPRPAPTHVLSVYGADRPGIVAAVTKALAELDVNITDLSTRLAGSPESPLYAMLVEVDLGGAGPQDVLAALREAAGSEIEVSLRELEAEAF